MISLGNSLDFEIKASKEFVGYIISSSKVAINLLSFSSKDGIIFLYENNPFSQNLMLTILKL